MRFQDPARDARAIVYAGIQADPLVARAGALLADATLAQRVLARAVMNGESTDRDGWRTMFPTLFADPPTTPSPGHEGTAPGPSRPADAGAPAHGDAERARSEAILDAALAVADRGEQVRSQVRGAIVEELTAVLLARRVGAAAVRRERRILFDGVRAEIHPYDVTVERESAAEAYDCKWGARGINADVLHQLDDARGHAADEEEVLSVALVVFDAQRSCDVRLDGQTAPHEMTGVVPLERLDALGSPAGRRP